MGNRRVDKRNGEEAPSLVDEVHAAVREAILSGEYPPGARLLVAKIATLHTLRDALLRDISAKAGVLREPTTMA